MGEAYLGGRCTAVGARGQTGRNGGPDAASSSGSGRGYGGVGAGYLDGAGVAVDAAEVLLAELEDDLLDVLGVEALLEALEDGEELEAEGHELAGGALAGGEDGNLAVGHAPRVRGAEHGDRVGLAEAARAHDERLLRESVEAVAPQDFVVVRLPLVALVDLREARAQEQLVELDLVRVARHAKVVERPLQLLDDLVATQLARRVEARVRVLLARAAVLLRVPRQVPAKGREHRVVDQPARVEVVGKHVAHRVPGEPLARPVGMPMHHGCGCHGDARARGKSE